MARLLTLEGDRADIREVLVRIDLSPEQEAEITRLLPPGSEIATLHGDFETFRDDGEYLYGELSVDSASYTGPELNGELGFWWKAIRLPPVRLPARLPRLNLPRALPRLPRFRATGLRLPKLPTFRAPKIPKFKAPKLPKFKAPKLPKMGGGDQMDTLQQLQDMQSQQQDNGPAYQDSQGSQAMNYSDYQSESSDRDSGDGADDVPEDSYDYSGNDASDDAGDDTLEGLLGFSIFPKKRKSNKNQMLLQNYLAIQSGNPDLVKYQAFRNVQSSINNKKRRKKQAAMTRNVIGGVGAVAATVLTGGGAALLGALPSLSSLGGIAGAAGTSLMSALGPMAGNVAGIASSIGVSGLDKLTGMLGPDGLSTIASKLGAGGLGDLFQSMGVDASKLATPEGVQSLLGAVQSGQTDPSSLAQSLQSALSSIPATPETVGITKTPNGSEFSFSRATSRGMNPIPVNTTVSASTDSSGMMIGSAIALALLFMKNKKR